MLPEALEAEERTSLLSTGKLGESDRPGEPGVPIRISGENDEMRCRRIDRPRPGLGTSVPLGREAELSPEDGGETEGACRFREPNDPVEPVMVGERERFETKTNRFFDKLFGRRGTVEETEVRVAVELRVRHRGRRAFDPLRWGIRRSAAGEPGSVAAVGNEPDNSFTVAPREATFELRPGDERIECTHGRRLSNICSIYESGSLLVQ